MCLYNAHGLVYRLMLEMQRYNILEACPRILQPALTGRFLSMPGKDMNKYIHMLSKQWY